MYKKVIITLFLAAILVACTNTKDGNVQYNNQSTEKTRPIHYDPNDKQNMRMDEENNPYMDDNPARYSDAFTNDESIRLSQALEQRRDIVQAQVASTEDRVIVSVKLNKHKDHYIAENLREEIQTIVPDKQIVIYTDDPHWERMKNIDTKLKSKNFGNDILDFFNKK